jgi:hypothetical protein
MNSATHGASQESMLRDDMFLAADSDGGRKNEHVAQAWVLSRPSSRSSLSQGSMGRFRRTTVASDRPAVERGV